jgi:hypothetical protein
MRSATAPKIRTSLSSFEEAALQKAMDAPVVERTQAQNTSAFAKYRAQSAAKSRNKYGY